MLLSGGLDSAALVGHYLKRGARVQPVYVADGLRWGKAERAAAARFLKALGSSRVAPLRVLRFEQSDLYAPGHWARRGRVPAAHTPDEWVRLEGRNLLLLAKAGTLCANLGIPRVALAILRGNPFPDARPEFFRSLERSLRLGLGRAVRIETPFARVKKEDVIRRHRDLPLGLTLSCIRPSAGRNCGDCSKCSERRDAFVRARIADPTPYPAR